MTSNSVNCHIKYTTANKQWGEGDVEITKQEGGGKGKEREGGQSEHIGKE